MAFSQVTPVIGKQQEGYLNIIDVVAKDQLGTVLTCVDNYWGAGEFEYVSFPAGQAITQGQLLVLSGYGPNAPVRAASPAPTTANTGRAVAVAINSVASLGVTQYGWVQRSGAVVMKCGTSVPAGSSFGLDSGTAGQVTTNSAGRQILNAVSVEPSTKTVLKPATVTAGSTRIVAGNVDGWFPGMPISGTGIPGGTTILALDPDNRTVTLTAAATAGGQPMLTGTYTGFIVGDINRSFLQGSIT